MTLHTAYDPKPVPVRYLDWAAWLGDMDEGVPVGYGATERAAVEELAFWVDIDVEDLLASREAGSAKPPSVRGGITK